MSGYLQGTKMEFSWTENSLCVTVFSNRVEQDNTPCICKWNP